ncbi:MAG TPA: hypothetical protein DDY31_08620, partial [Lachnospiraceae bacterium]|nr:hypothetical protein [Lachnospiraceae bacterium]
KNDKEITAVRDGEIYLTGEMFYDSPNHFKIGDTITITDHGKTKTFHIKGSMKDAMFGSSMIGMTRFLISENDYAYFNDKDTNKFYSLLTYTDDS